MVLGNSSFVACVFSQARATPSESERPVRRYLTGGDPLQCHPAADRCGRWTVWFGCARTLLPVRGTSARDLVRAPDDPACLHRSSGCPTCVWHTQ